MSMFTSLNAIVPMTCVAAAGIAAMVAEALRTPGERAPIAPLGAIGLAGAAAASLLLWNRNVTSFGLVVADNFGLFVTFVLVVVGLLSLSLSGPSVERLRLPQGEYYALMLLALSGMMLMATSADLLLIFLALEVLSLAVYVLTGIRRDSPAAVEGALKYFILGAFSSAFFLYGIAFTYGLTGTTRLDRIGALLAGRAMAPGTLQLVAAGLLLVGFGFKVSAIPFHMWTPDAYEGAPTVVTAFMSTGVKAAAFAAFVRVFLAAFEPLHPHWRPVVWAIALATMVGGTVVAVAQTNVKRMLAYSAIAHAGYLLVALASANDLGKGAVLFYLLAYAVTNLGAFGVVAMLETPDRPFDQIADYAGLAAARPLLALSLTTFLLSLGGLPPLGGFVAKWYVFSAAVEAGEISLAVVGVLTSVISVFFYLRLVVMMYMTPASRPSDGPAVPLMAGAALAASALAVVYLGVLPGQVLEWAAASVATIF